MRNRGINRRNKLTGFCYKSAFTLVELIVVIAIIGILATITIVSYSGWKQSTIVAQIKSDLNNVAAAMENARTFGDSYPSSVPATFTPSSGVTLTGGSADGGETYCVSAVNSQFSNLSYYISSSNSEQGAQSGLCPTVQKTLTLIAGAGGDVSGGGTYDMGTSHTITATPKANYAFSSWTGTGCSGSASHSVTLNSNMTCTANFIPSTIAAPSTPSVSASTPGSITTWSWGAASCPGNSARYQYRYTISPAGFDSGWIPTSATSVGFTTSTDDQTYTVAVQAQCYNSTSSSAWSASGTAGYYRPIPMCTLTINAGNGGTVNSGGSYDCGDTPDSPIIIATPNQYYSFSSWTGSVGCSGTASHTITMDSDKTCTANFTPTPIATPSTPSVSQSTPGSTTTWSWGAASCGTNTAGYQYLYTISPSGYSSGWVSTSSTSVAFTTSTQGQTYAVYVQARCYNTVTTSGWSGSGAAGYYRPITYTLTLGGAYGTYTGAGTYYEGTTVTMTSNPSATYYFNSWSGSSGCAGAQSHTIYMNENKSCTATNTHWIPGLASTQMYGKFVYYQDDATQRRFKVNTNADNDSWSTVGLDPYNSSYRILKDPQVYSMNWDTYYPANYYCSVIGGRLPLPSEMSSIYQNKAYYGNNWNTSEGYRTAAENPNNTSYAINRNMANDTTTVSLKTNSNPTRCIDGPY